MHCPRCGHEQTSDQIRFCTKCGLALEDVKGILASPPREIEAGRKNNIGRGVRQGLALMLFGFVLITILAILRDFNLVPQVFIKIAALVFCIGGAFRMGSAYIFSGDQSEGKNRLPVEDDAGTNKLPGQPSADKALPQAQYNPPVNFETNSFDTGKIPVPSVTEHTTKSLKELKAGN